jgi:5-methylcytosine-specific restriction endonuclease McrA
MAYLASHPCVVCGEPDIVVLEFDHLHDKTANISDLIHQNVPLKRLIEEIEKCQVLCANCHRKKTANSFGSYRLAGMQLPVS